MPLDPDDKKPTITDDDDGFVPLGGTSSRPLSLGIPHAPGLANSPNFSPDTILNKTIDFIRPFIGNTAGSLAAIPGAAVGGPIGSFGAETQGYALADTALKYLKTEPPGSLGESLTDSERDALINAVGGRIIGRVFKVGQAIRNANMPEIYKMFPTTSQALENYGYHKLATTAKLFEDLGSPGSKSTAQARSGFQSFMQALQLSKVMNGRDPLLTNADPAQLYKSIREQLAEGLTPGVQPGSKQFQSKLHYASQEALNLLEGGQNPFQALDDVISNRGKLNKYLSLGQQYAAPGSNLRGDLQAYQWTRMFNQATKQIAPGQARVNPEILNSIWNKPELQGSLNDLYGAGIKKNLDEFIGKVLQVQDKPIGGELGAKLKYIGGGFSLAGGLATMLGVPQGAVVGSLYIPTAAMGKILTSTPETAKYLTSLLESGGQQLSMNKQIASRAIFNALQGSSIALMDDKGKKTWGKVAKEPDGGWQLLPEK